MVARTLCGLMVVIAAVAVPAVAEIEEIDTAPPDTVEGGQGRATADGPPEAPAGWKIPADIPGSVGGPLIVPERLVLPERSRLEAADPLTARPRTVRSPVANHRGGPIGEYATQQALLLAWIPDNDEACPVQLEIARLVSPTTHVILIAPDADGVRHARAALKTAGIDDDNITFLDCPIDTPWIRDYGPFAVRDHSGMLQLIDAPYGTERMQDDRLPEHLGRHLELSVVETTLIVEGGNLLSNGDGLLVCSTSMVGDNQDQGLTVKQIRSKLLDQWGAREAVFVDPLAGEPTGHVDMLMTFPRVDTVIVGDYPEDSTDRFNHLLLNETAERLASVRLRDGRALTVLRVPMPEQTDPDVWPTYCNVVYANGVLLVPYYPESRDSFHAAVAVYRRVLPGWRIAGVDCSTIIRSGGAVHCLTATIPAHRALTDRKLFRGRRVVRVPATVPQDSPLPRWRPPVAN